MKYEAGNRFNPDTYIKTEVDSASVTVKVYGELEGVEVDFNSGDIPEITSLSVTENGTYEAPEGTAYDPVTVEVPNSYTAADEGKVVSSGALVAQTSRTVTSNDTYDTTTNNEVVVAVPGPSGSINITQNGTVDVTNYASAVVNVGGSDATLKGLIDRSISSVSFPSDVTSIGQYAFGYCFNIGDLTIPGHIVTIGNYAFYQASDNGLSGDRKVTISEGCQTISDYAFQQSKFKIIDLPSTITQIKTYAFAGMSYLTDLYCRAITPPSKGIGNIGSTALQHIYVPAESVSAYQNDSNWSEYAAKISAIPTP